MREKGPQPKVLYLNEPPPLTGAAVRRDTRTQSGLNDLLGDVGVNEERPSHVTAAGQTGVGGG